MDRIIRLAAAAVVAVLFFTGYISGALAIVLMVVAAVFALTAFISFCPIYAALGWSTNKKSENS